MNRSDRRRSTPALCPQVWAALAILLAAPLTAQETTAGKEPKRIPRAGGEIRIDGTMDEPAWAAALRIEVPYEIHPGDNTEAPVRTEALLLYDDGRLYVGIRAWDPEPERIRARLSDRDRAFQDDFAGLVIDTFNDERRAFEFFVNPVGVQMDLVVDDVNGNEDESWDAIWESAGELTADGYVVELALPYTSLRFQRGAGAQVWGLDVVRVYPRDQRYVLASNVRDQDLNCYLCQIDKIVGFEGVTPGRNLEVTPTLTADRTDELDDFPDGEFVTGQESTELGLTMHWGVTPNLILSGTVNPDFSQVEADVAQLDVNEQFALFFPEKRPFFLEGADFFETSINAVHTRTLAEPRWGVKVTGKEGAHAVGLFVAEDDTSTLLLPGFERSTVLGLDQQATAAVARYRRDLGQNSALGVLLTAREGAGYHNRVGGIDALLRLTENDTLRVQALGSQTEYPREVLEEFRGDRTFEQPEGEFDGHALSLSYGHGNRDWSVHASYRDFGERFRSDLGFVPRVGYRQPRVSGRYTWWLDDNERWSFLEAGAEWSRSERQNGDLIEEEVEVFFVGGGPRQFFFFVEPSQTTKVFNGVEFSQDSIRGRFEIQPSKDLALELSFNTGDREDVVFSRDQATGVARQGRQWRINPELRYNLGRHLRIDLDHTHQSLDDDDSWLFRADQTELRLVYQFNVRMFLRAIVQNTDVRRNIARYPAELELEPESQDLFGQFLFSYKLNPQTALFVGYTDERLALEGTRLTQTGRTFFLKVGYAWVG